MKNLNREALPTGLVCGALGLFVLITTLTYPDVSGQGFGQGPAFYPQVLASTLIALGLLIIVGALKGTKTYSRTKAENPSDSIRIRPLLPYQVLALSIVLMIAMQYLGFLVSGFLLVAITIFLIQPSFKIGALIRGTAFSLGIIFLAYLVFELFIGIELPPSSLWGA